MSGDDWRRRAACIGHDPELFWPVKENGATAARQAGDAIRICRTCPVRRECEDDANRHHETAGVWGGKWRKPRSSPTPVPTREGMLGVPEISDLLELSPRQVRRVLAESRDGRARGSRRVTLMPEPDEVVAYGDGARRNFWRPDAIHAWLNVYRIGSRQRLLHLRPPDELDPDRVDSAVRDALAGAGDVGHTLTLVERREVVAILRGRERLSAKQAADALGLTQRTIERYGGDAA